MALPGYQGRRTLFVCLAPGAGRKQNRCSGTLERAQLPLIRSVGGHGNLMLGGGEKLQLDSSRSYQTSRQLLILDLNSRTHPTFFAHGSQRQPGLYGGASEGIWKLERNNHFAHLCCGVSGLPWPLKAAVPFHTPHGDSLLGLRCSQISLACPGSASSSPPSTDISLSLANLFCLWCLVCWSPQTTLFF